MKRHVFEKTLNTPENVLYFFVAADGEKWCVVERILHTCERIPYFFELADEEKSHVVEKLFQHVFAEKPCVD